MSAAELPRPGIEILQEFRSTSPTIVTPTLVSCNIAPFFEVLEVQNSDGTLNADSQFTDVYQQLGLTIPQGSFPAPRGNIDEIDIQEDTIRAFLNFGGTVRELPQDSGFLKKMEVSTQPFVAGTGTAPFDLDGERLIVALDAHSDVGGPNIPNDVTGTPLASANVNIDFTADGLTAQQVADAINEVISDLASVNGSGNVVLTSPSWGAGASITVRRTGSANGDIGFSASKDEIAVGSGFYAIDDSDGDLLSPRIEVFGGTTQRLIDDANNLDQITVPDFGDEFIEAGDVIVADGVNIGEVNAVFSGRLIMEVEQSIFGADSPFAPKYVWVQAYNLTFPAPASSVAATITGTESTAPATRAYIFTDTIGSMTFPVAAAETFDVDVLVGGVAQATEVITSGGGWADLASAISDINTQATNFQAYPAGPFGDELPTAAHPGARMGLRTLASNTGSSASLTYSNPTSGMTLGITPPSSDVGENIRYLPGTPVVMISDLWTGLAGARVIAANSFIYTPTINGVAQAVETIGWTAAHANTLPAGLTAAVADWNAQASYSEAYESDASGNEVTAGTGTYLAVRTVGEAVGTDTELDFATPGGSTDVTLFASITPAWPGVYAGTDTDLDGAEFKWLVDDNPQTQLAVFVADEDDGGTSLQSVLDKINTETPLVASASGDSPPKLVLTSGMVGESSKLEIGTGGANTILGFTGAATAAGNGRPSADLSLDISGQAIINHQVLRDGLSGTPFLNGAAPIHGAYKALRLDLSPDAVSPGLLRVETTTQLEQVAAPISSDNPGSLMTFLTLLNSPGQSATAIGVPEISADAPDGTPLGYAKCFEFLESEEVYGIAAASQLSVVHQAGLTHVNYMSEAEQKGERVFFFNPVTPDRRLPTLLGSGTDANTSATPGKVVVDVNLAPELLAQGIDPANVNPTSGAIVNEVYLDLGGDDNYYLVWKVENGVDVFLRKDFVTGDGNDDSFFATDYPINVISDDWTVAIRGAELLVPGTSDPDKNGIAETIQAAASAYGFRRGYYVFPDQVGINVTGLEQIVEGYYATSCVIGMVAGLPPQQGFTNYPIAGLTQVVGSNDIFTERQLNVMAAGGVYILVQDAIGAPVICRHQLSTDLSSIERRELSITKVVDFTAKFIRVGLRTFIGRVNITQAFLDQLSSVLQGLLSFLTETGVLIGAEINNIIQDADAPDTVLVDITLDVPFPCNYIRVTLVI